MNTAMIDCNKKGHQIIHCSFYFFNDMPWCRSETIAVEEDNDERSIREEQSRSHETNDAVEVGLDTETPKNGPTIYRRTLLKMSTNLIYISKTSKFFVKVLICLEIYFKIIT